MAITSKYIFAASMDVAPDKEALFNEVYDIEHALRVRIDQFDQSAWG